MVAGFDENDPTTIDKVVPDYRLNLKDSVVGLKVGVPTNYYFDELDTEVEESINTAIKTLENLGAKIIEIEIPGLDGSSFDGAITIRAEAATYHYDRLMENPQLFGSDVRSSLEVQENAFQSTVSTSSIFKEQTQESVFSYIPKYGCNNSTNADHDCS